MSYKSVKNIYSIKITKVLRILNANNQVLIQVQIMWWTDRNVEHSELEKKTNLAFLYLKGFFNSFIGQ